MHVYKLFVLKVAVHRMLASTMLAACLASVAHAQDQVSLRVELVWATAEARATLSAIGRVQSRAVIQDQLQAFRLEAGDSGKRAIQLGRRNGAIVPISVQTLVAGLGRTASFVVGGKAETPYDEVSLPAPPAPETLEDTDLLALPPLYPAPPRLRDFGIKLSLTAQEDRDGGILLLLDGHVNGVDFAKATPKRGRSKPALTYREFRQVLQLTPNETFVVAGMFTAEDLLTLQRAPGLAETDVFHRIVELETVDSEGCALLLITPELIIDEAGVGGLE